MTLNFLIFHTVPLLISRKIALHFFVWKRGWKKKGRHACCLWEKFWGKFFGKRNENFWKRCLKADDVSCGEKNENASDNTLEKGAAGILHAEIALTAKPEKNLEIWPIIIIICGWRIPTCAFLYTWRENASLSWHLLLFGQCCQLFCFKDFSFLFLEKFSQKLFLQETSVLTFYLTLIFWRKNKFLIIL